ncbi:hypothetical protein [Aliarcobacter butzleri]|uniref:hypothetical protein n=1 Tax=Aliarcobacter butzleri TaxID=28197 RepID=UPI001ED9F9E7|nr:hypothetical protein [Aliarcobacter butzleri]MCG3692593.1 hypothetical protein [Aliarcobacter butzleri]MCT7609954.1 hypothetical protein [Aliarcobacter butzleri]
MDELENNLDATLFLPAVNNYQSEFQNLISKIYLCYELMIRDKVELPSNDENGIRDILLINYLQKKHIRNNICNIHGFRFIKEVDVNDGRVDIQIISSNDFEEDEAFYVIECKRLDGNSKLNKAYVKDGIDRFTTKYKSENHEYYYPSQYGVNGMIGFVIKNININNNMLKIGNFFNIIENNKIYNSNHENCKLFHLMLDISTLCK